MTESTKRRFQRVPINNQFLNEVKPFMNVRARWGVFEDVAVLDLSFRGAALARPDCGVFQKDDQIKLIFELPEKQVIEVPSRIAWAKEKVIGIEFLPLNDDVRSALEYFLNDKLIGLMLRRINPKYVAAYNDMDYWFNGPNYTNIFIWQKNMVLSRAIMELADEIVAFEDNNLVKMDRSSADGSLNRSSEPPSRNTIKKLVGLLGNVADQDGVLAPLVKELVRRS
jgi:hypothetical protein